LADSLPEPAFICLSVAIVVSAVADLFRFVASSGVTNCGTGRVVDVAADHSGSFAEPEPFETDVTDCLPLTFIHVAVTVVVHTVTDFGGCFAWLSATYEVPHTIVWVTDKHTGPSASAVAVEADFADAAPLRFLVDFPITVVVLSVTDFG
jgi:hypothetical protein